MTEAQTFCVSVNSLTALTVLMESALGNELVNIFQNASIGTTVKIITFRLKLQKKKLEQNTN